MDREANSERLVTLALSFDEAKRLITLEQRGLDFAHANQVFAGLTVTIEDDRKDYGEVRYQTIGRLRRSVVMVVWTPRGEGRHIISMRKCNAKERAYYQRAVDRSG